MNDSALGRVLPKAGIVVGLALLILLSILPKASTLFFTWPLVLYGQLLLLAPVLLLGCTLINRPTAWRQEWTPLVAMALAIGVSVAFSRRPAFSLEASLFLFSGLAWYGFVVVKISDAKNTSNGFSLLARLVGFVFFLPLLTGLIYWLQDWNEFAPPTGSLLPDLSSLFAYRNLHPFGHWNYTGGFVLLALPWFGALLWIERGRWRAVWLTCTIVGVAIFFSASSRGAVLGTLAMLAAAFGAAIYTKTISKKQITLLALTGCVLAVGLLAANPRLRAVIASPSSVLQPNEGDVQRIGMLQGGWLLAQQRPWLGHGPGMTPFVFPEVRAQLDGGVETAFQLHNGPLQLWVDHGLLGLLCATALAVALLRSTLRWLKSPPSTLRTFALACALSLVGYSVLFLTDYQLNVVAFVAALGLQAGLVLAAPVVNAPTTQPTIRWLGGAILAAGISILIVLVPAWRARQTYASAWETDQPAETLARLEHTVTLAPRNPYYLNQLALRRARLAEQTADVATATTLRTQARAELAHSLSLDTAQEPVHASLGWLWLYEDPKRAETHFRAAIALLPDRDTLRLGLALCRLAQDDQSGAVRELALECLANPSFVASPLWKQEPLLSLRKNVLEQLFENYRRLLQHPALPQWRKPQLVFAMAFQRWWLGGPVPSLAELHGALPPQQQFFAFLAATNSTKLPTPTPAWAVLEQARANPSQAEAILCSVPRPPDRPALAGAIVRLARPTSDLPTLLRSVDPNNTGVILNQITRAHYSIMHNVLDGPGYDDLSPRIVDAFTATYAAPLFPPRGAIPGTIMLELMSQPN